LKVSCKNLDDDINMNMNGECNLVVKNYRSVLLDLSNSVLVNRAHGFSSRRHETAESSLPVCWRYVSNGLLQQVVMVQLYAKLHSVLTDSYRDAEVDIRAGFGTMYSNATQCAQDDFARHGCFISSSDRKCRRENAIAMFGLDFG
jgi:hypothetical protein